MKRIFFTLFFSILLFLGFSVHADAANWKSFAIDKYLDYNSVLITDGMSHYIVEHSFGCNIYSWDEGKTIYIDTNYSIWPSFYDDIVFGDDTCYITNFPEELDLYTLYVEEVNSLDRYVIVKSNTTRYIVEYGFGCYSMSSKKYSNIYVDSLSGYLSTFGKLYLFDVGTGYESCSISKVTTLTETKYGDNNDNVQKVTAPVPNKSAPIGLIANIIIKKQDIKRKSVILNWAYSGKESVKYRIKVFRRIKNGTYVLDEISVSSGKMIKIKGLKPNTLYKIKIRAFKDDKKGNWSSWKVFITKR